MHNALRLVPLGITLATVIAMGAVGLYQIGTIAEDVVKLNDEVIAELSNEVSANEDEIESLQRLRIARQGEIGLDLERLRIEQKSQSEQLDKQSDQLDEQGRKLDKVLGLLQRLPPERAGD